MKKSGFPMMALGLVSMVITGCSAPTTHIAYIRPETHSTGNSNIVLFDQDKDTTWQYLLSKFSNSPFHIDSINNDSYHLKVVLNGQPELYVDCGKRTITTENQAKTVTNANSRYSFSAYRDNHLDTYQVENNFTGKANILVSGNDLSSKASVQTIMELDSIEERSTTQGAGHKRVRKKKLKFKNGEEPFSDILGTTCRSTGKFEESLVDFINLHPF